MTTWSLKFGHGLLDFFHLHRPAPVGNSKPATPIAPASRSRELNERRAEAMRGIFPKLSAWLAKRSYLAEMRDVDRYLSQATDLYDLERRIRQLDRSDRTFRIY